MTLQLQQIALEQQALTLQQQDLQNRLREAQAKAPLLKERLANRHRLEALGLAPRISDERLQAEQLYLDNQDKIAALTAQLTGGESAQAARKQRKKSVAARARSLHQS
jgi:hypothetical protein